MVCTKCGKDIQPSGGGTGYGIDDHGNAICYACCGSLDADDLRSSGKLFGYFNGVAFTNWPGSLVLPITSKSVSRNNFGAKRTDFWLTWEGRSYHGIQIGDSSECATLKLLKKRKAHK